MKLTKVEGCCSMLTISNNPHPETKKDIFIRDLAIEMKSSNSIFPSNVKTIMMVTNCNLYYRMLYRLMGFKKAYSYKGNYSILKAHVMYLDFTKIYKNYKYFALFDFSPTFKNTS